MAFSSRGAEQVYASQQLNKYYKGIWVSYDDYHKYVLPFIKPHERSVVQNYGYMAPGNMRRA
jgi:hypothetical protein